jgi:hypothetical protein
MEELENPYDTSNESVVVRAMVHWFLQNFEDPCENTPRDSGEWVWIHGGPFSAGEELHQMFGDVVDEGDIERACGILGIGEWAPHPDGCFYERRP